MLDRESNSIQRELVKEWRNFQAEMARLHSAAEVRPDDGNEVFRVVDSPMPELVAVELEPAVFNLPERGDDSTTDLFVVIRGRMSFMRQGATKIRPLHMHDFGTEIGYFRRKSAGLVHVYGAHYDIAVNEVGHPVFHAQMRSFTDFSTHIRKQYTITGEDNLDHVKGILKTVRLPTAQMDIFATIVQLMADHLLYSGSGGEERKAFNDVLVKSNFCKGAGHRSPQLSSHEARGCNRAHHWYPQIV